MVAIPGSLISSISPIASLTTLRLMSRLIVEAAHPSSAAMERIELPVTTEREISSRSANVSAILDLRRTAGLIPQSPPRCAVSMSGFDQIVGRCAEERRLSANDPTSVISGVRCNRSEVSAP